MTWTRFEPSEELLARFRAYYEQSCRRDPHAVFLDQFYFSSRLRGVRDGDWWQCERLVDEKGSQRPELGLFPGPFTS